MKFNKKVVNIDGGKNSAILLTEDGFVYRTGKYYDHKGYKTNKIPTKAPINIYPFKQVINNKKFIYKDFEGNNYKENIITIKDNNVIMKQY